MLSRLVASVHFVPEVLSHVRLGDWDGCRMGLAEGGQGAACCVGVL